RSMMITTLKVVAVMAVLNLVLFFVASDVQTDSSVGTPLEILELRRTWYPNSDKVFGTQYMVRTDTRPELSVYDTGDDGKVDEVLEPCEKGSGCGWRILFSFTAEEGDMRQEEAQALLDQVLKLPMPGKIVAYR
ncbi:MAG: hypothetical protein ABIP54_02480, partial [Candidatus Andersenbacteria bacterium]